MFSKLKSFLLEMIFPKINTTGIIVNQTFFCPACRARQPKNAKICHKDIPYKLAAATRYDGPVKEWVHALKYRKRQGVLQPIADILVKYLSKLEFNFNGYVIIPIPLFPAKERKRGFNQAKLIAEKASVFLNIPIFNNILVKIRDTKTQTEMENYREREKNVTGCFAVSNPKLITDKKLILVDDVFTSGATTNEAVRTLRAAGAVKIIALVIAKAG